MPKMTCGEVVGACLKGAGTEHVFGLPGHGNIGLLDGVFKSGLEFIMCHHETICGQAADAYFRAGGRPGVVCLTCGPGAFNAQLAVTSAAMDASAVVYIVGDIPAAFAGRTAYEEFDLHGPDDQFTTLRPMFKRAWKVSRPELLAEALCSAFNVAQTGRPGPVLVNIPFDLHKQVVDAEVPSVDRRRPWGRPHGDPGMVERAARLLADAGRPVIYAGGGAYISRATGRLLQLAERLDAPVVCSLGGSAGVPTAHPLVAGTIGSYGNKHANDLCLAADVLLAVGTRFEESETSMWLRDHVFNIPPTRLIQVDIEPREIGKNYDVEVGIVGDARAVLDQLLGALAGGPVQDRGSRREVGEHRRAWMDRIRKYMESDEVPINPRRVLHELERRFPEDGTLAVDPSWCRIGLLQQFGLTRPGQALVVSGLLPIGWSTAAPIGIRAARPDSPVLALAGDGGFLMNLQSVATAVEYDMPIVWVVLNNRGYNALGVLQNAYFGSGTRGSFFSRVKSGEDYSPDYSAIARACGADGERVTDPAEVGPALERALAADGPYVLDIIVSRQGSRLVRTAQVTWDYFWERANR